MQSATQMHAVVRGTEGYKMDTITAGEARQISHENLRGPAIESFVSALSNKIRSVAREGKSGFDPWLYFGSLRTPSPTPEQKEAIRKHFENCGFAWKDHPAPDPGHPASRPYTVLSW